MRFRRRDSGLSAGSSRRRAALAATTGVGGLQASRSGAVEPLMKPARTVCPQGELRRANQSRHDFCTSRKMLVDAAGAFWGGAAAWYGQTG